MSTVPSRTAAFSCFTGRSSSPTQEHLRRDAPRRVWSITVVAAGLLLYIYWDALSQMGHQWLSDENYSHGLLVPFVVGYLLWRGNEQSAALPSIQHPWGLLLIAMGSAVYIVGEVGSLYFLLQLSLWLVGIGLLIAAQGLPRTKALWFPLVYLLTAIPLPNLLYQSLSSKLQLISSSLSVSCLQVIGITAFRDGNVIDLGLIQLQVVEACSGLRYLFPLFSLALLCGYLYQGQLWKRILLVLSSIPISILLNGFRIGVVGLLVDLYGPSAGEGFLHLFEGWIIFLVSVGIVWIEVLILNRVAPISGPPGPAPQRSDGLKRHASAQPLAVRTYGLAVGLVGLLAVSATYTIQRDESVPLRRSFVDFPMAIGTWTGAPFALDQHYRDALRVDDYLLADFHIDPSHPVSLYAVYYNSQRKGQSVHSPQSCIPGGGWEITELEQRDLSSVLTESQPFLVNRAVIAKGEDRQIVYYWFKQRDRILANEYLVKGYLLWDSLMRHRTDGAMVRLSASIPRSETESETDERLIQLATHIVPLFDQYIPN